MTPHDDEITARAAAHQSKNGTIQARVIAKLRPVHKEMPVHFPDKDFPQYPVTWSRSQAFVL
jgi:hypothetical protein